MLASRAGDRMASSEYAESHLEQAFKTAHKNAQDDQDIEYLYTYTDCLASSVSNKKSHLYDERNRHDLKDYDMVFFQAEGQADPMMLTAAFYLQHNGVPFANIELADRQDDAVVIEQGVGLPGQTPELTRQQTVIGRVIPVEIDEMPELGSLKAKIDTGAYSNSLHIEYVEEIVDETGEKTLQYSAAVDKAVVHKTKHYFRKTVRSSNGHPEERFVVELHIKFGGQRLIGHVSLTQRNTMKYPMLIGRRFLQQHSWIVDVTKRNMT